MQFTLKKFIRFSNIGITGKDISLKKDISFPCLPPIGSYIDGDTVEEINFYTDTPIIFVWVSADTSLIQGLYDQEMVDFSDENFKNSLHKLLDDYSKKGWHV